MFKTEGGECGEWWSCWCCLCDVCKNFVVSKARIGIFATVLSLTSATFEVLLVTTHGDAEAIVVSRKFKSGKRMLLIKDEIRQVTRI